MIKIIIDNSQKEGNINFNDVSEETTKKIIDLLFKDFEMNSETN